MTEILDPALLRKHAGRLANCAGCGRGVRILANGTLEYHYQGGGGPGRPLPCWGSGDLYTNHGDSTGNRWKV